MPYGQTQYQLLNAAARSTQQSAQIRVPWADRVHKTPMGGGCPTMGNSYHRTNPRGAVSMTHLSIWLPLPVTNGRCARRFLFPWHPGTSWHLSSKLSCLVENNNKRGRPFCKHAPSPLPRANRDQGPPGPEFTRCLPAPNPPLSTHTIQLGRSKLG